MIEKILIRAPQELKEVLRSEAIGHGATINQLILQILWDWANKNTFNTIEKGQDK